MTTDSDPPDDPLITRYVEAALEGCTDMSPKAMEAMRAWLYVFYETNPEAVALLDEIRAAEQPAPFVARSGEQVRRGLEALVEAARPQSGGAKGGRR